MPLSVEIMNISFQIAALYVFVPVSLLHIRITNAGFSRRVLLFLSFLLDLQKLCNLSQSAEVSASFFI